jgi:O-antigen/teichoic acid export membrane protein
MALKKDVSIYLSVNIINKAVPFFMLPLLTRYIDPKEYGLMEMFVLAGGLLCIFIGISAHSAVTIAYFDLPDRRDFSRYTGTAFIILVITFFVMLALMTGLQKQLAVVTHLELGWMILAAVYALGKFVSLTNLTLWRVEKKTFSYGLYQIVCAIVDISLTVVLVVFLSTGWQGRVFSIVATVVIFSIVSQWILQKRGYLKWKWDKTYAKAMLRYSLPLVPNTLSFWIRGSLDVFMIASFVSVKEAGIFAVSITLGKGILLLVESYAQAWSPHVFAVLSRREGDRQQLVQQSYQYMAGLAIVGLCYIWAIPIIFPWFIDNRFHESLKYLPYLVIAQIFGGWYRTFAVYIYYSKRTGTITLSTIAVTLFHVMLLYFMVRQYGLIGAALAIVGSSFVAFLSVVFLSNRVFPMPWNRLWISIGSME